MTFLPLATLKDLSILDKQKGMFIGSTNILISQTPVIKPDLIINLDDNFFEYKPTDLSRISKTSTKTDKAFIDSLLKDLKDMDHQIPPKDQFSWDSIPMGDGQMLNSLDYVDSFIRSKVSAYFETMLIRLSFYRKIIRGEIMIEVEQSALEDAEDFQINEQDWDIVSP